MQWQLLRFPLNVRISFALTRSLQPWGVQYLSQNALNPPNIATLLATPPIADAPTITAVGSVRTIRNQKLRSFVEIGDGSTVHTLQALLQPNHAEGYASSPLYMTEATLMSSLIG